MTATLSSIAKWLGVLAAALTLVSWVIVPVALYRGGEILKPPDGSYKRARDAKCWKGAWHYLNHINDFRKGWKKVHISFTIGMRATLLLPGLIKARLAPDGPLAAASVAVGMFGVVLAFLATLLDLHARPC